MSESVVHNITSIPSAEPTPDPIEEAKNNVVESAKKAFTPRGVANFVVGSSIKYVVTSTIASLVPVESRKDRLKVAVAGYVISGIVADKAKSHIGADIDNKVAYFKEVMAKVKELQAQADTSNEQ